MGTKSVAVGAHQLALLDFRFYVVQAVPFQAHHRTDIVDLHSAHMIKVHHTWVERVLTVTARLPLGIVDVQLLRVRLGTSSTATPNAKMIGNYMRRSSSSTELVSTAPTNGSIIELPFRCLTLKLFFTSLRTLLAERHLQKIAAPQIQTSADRTGRYAATWIDARSKGPAPAGRCLPSRTRTHAAGWRPC